MSPGRLVHRLARWIDDLPADRVRIGFDGDETVGTADLADAVAAAVDRPSIRVSTRWWMRAASLRLEYGREDVESRLAGWIDAGALRREVTEPLAPGGSGRYLTRLRDPARDRAIRQDYRQAPARVALLLDGPFLASAGQPLDAIVRVGVSAGRLARALPEGRRWELAAFAEYQRRWPAAAVVISYDHPDAPAVAGLRR